MKAEANQKQQRSIRAVETEFSRQGKTKLVPYQDDVNRFRFLLFKEVWVKGRSGWTRGYHALIELGENRLVLSSDSLWNVLHQAGKHLTLLSAPKERMR